MEWEEGSVSGFWWWKGGAGVVMVIVVVMRGASYYGLVGWVVVMMQK